MFVCALDWSGNINHSFPFPCTQSLSISDIDLQKKYGCTDWTIVFLYFSSKYCKVLFNIVIEILSVVLSKKNSPPFTPPHSVWGWVGLEEEEEEYKERGWIEFALSLLPRSKELLEWRGLGEKKEGGWWVHHSMFNPLQSPPLRKKSVGESSAAESSWPVFGNIAGGGVGFCISLFHFCLPVAVWETGLASIFFLFPFHFLSPSIQPQACGDFKLPSRSRISRLKIGLFLLWWMRYGQIPMHFFSSTKYPLFWGNKCIFFLEILSCTNTGNSCLSKAPLSPTSTKFPNLYSLFGDEGQAKHIPLLSILDQRRGGCQTLTSSSQPPLFSPSWRKFQQTRNFLFITFPVVWDLGVTVKHI